jgi:hypothetical protein
VGCARSPEASRLTGRLRVDLARILGTDEPAFADPDAALLTAVDEWRSRVDRDRLRARVESLPGPRNRLHHPEAMARTDDLIADAWRAAGWRVGVQRLRLRNVRGILDFPDPGRSGLRLHTYGSVEGKNLVAVAAGETDEAVVVVAHHDTVRDSPGADDNGAAVAVLLELADALGRRRRRRTVVLAAPDFEEIGMVGSRPLVRWLKRHYRVTAALVFDPIGYMNAAPGAQTIPPGLEHLYPRQVAQVRARDYAGDAAVAVYRRRSARVAAEWARCVAAVLGRDRVLMLRDPLDIPILGRLAVAVPVARNFSRSDHVRFWEAGLPAVQLTNTANFRNPNYHRPTDTPDTLDYETLAGVAAATGLAVERLAAT